MFSGKPDLEFFNAQEDKEQSKPGQDTSFKGNVAEAVALQHNAFYNCNKIFRGHYITEPLQYEGHVFNRENKTTKQDSIVLRKDFINNWVKEQLVFYKALANLTDQEKNKEINQFFMLLFH